MASSSSTTHAKHQYSGSNVIEEKNSFNLWTIKKMID
jgi:hypothetical protein